MHRQLAARSRSALVGAVDLRQHLAHRALVVLREIDLNPGEAARADGVQRSHLRELAKRTRRPVAQAAGGDEPVHDVDQLGAALRAELHDAEVLAVGVVRIHLLRHLAHPAAAAPAPSSLRRRTAPGRPRDRRAAGRSRVARSAGRPGGPGGRERHNLGPRTPQIAEVVPSTASTCCSSGRNWSSQRR